MAGRVQSPEQELRFTRSRQAVGFWLLGAVLVAGAVTLAASGYYRAENPRLPHPAWGLAPLILALPVWRTAVRLTRHAYLILTPLGVEIFPFFRPATRLQLVMWQEIAAAEINPAHTVLTLHYNREKSAGIHLSLRPIRADRRALLATAVTERVRMAGMKDEG